MIVVGYEIKNSPGQVIIVNLIRIIVGEERTGGGEIVMLLNYAGQFIIISHFHTIIRIKNHLLSHKKVGLLKL